MKKGLTHIIFVVDRSGSMFSIAGDMIGGYNEFIKKQKELPDKCIVSFYQFDDVYETVFERENLQDVKDLTAETYQPRGSTALYDAMIRTIDSYGQYLANLKEEERPERILFITITDGFENASENRDVAAVRERVKHQKEKYDWDFIFLGSNIDAWDTSGTIGVAASATLQFANSKGSVSNAFNSLADGTSAYRACSAKMNYAFTAQDYADQEDFLADDKKAKNKQAQDAADKAAKKSKKV